MTVTFPGVAPVAVAVQMGTGTFTAAQLNGNNLNFTLPAGTAKYAIGYVCPVVAFAGDTFHDEFVVEATILDGTSYTLNSLSTCAGSSPSMSSVSGTVDASAITGANYILIDALDSAGYISSNNGSFSLSLPNGTNDLAFIALNANSSSGAPLAVKILRNQTVPGTLNAGNPIVFASSDQATPQSISADNLPTGFGLGIDYVNYVTANGTSIPLNLQSALQYGSVSSANTQTGDFYSYKVLAQDKNAQFQGAQISMTQNTTNLGAPAILAFPDPWTYFGPQAATFPTFTFEYSGFFGITAVDQQAELSWTNGANTFYGLWVTATASYQNGATSITIPDLTSLAGFLPSASSGTSVSWTANIFGGTEHSYLFSGVAPANGSLANVQNTGTYTQP